MANPTLISSIGFFTGLNTVDDVVRLRTTVVETPEGNKAAYPLTIASNVEIDNSYGLKSRVGLTSKQTGTNIHSLWASGTLCFFVDGNVLYQLQPDYSLTTIATVNPARMSFAEFNDRVYYSNGVNKGYIKDSVSYGFTAQTKNYKQPLPAGKFLAVYKSCLYVAVKNILYISDALSDCYDLRSGFRQFNESITMIQPVEKGIYVSDDKTWFMAGDSPLEMVRTLADGEPAIPYTSQLVDGQLIGEGMDGFVAVWTTAAGICIGDNSGAVKNITMRKYVMPDVTEGAAVLREINGETHYLISLKH